MSFFLPICKFLVVPWVPLPSGSFRAESAELRGSACSLQSRVVLSWSSAGCDGSDAQPWVPVPASFHTSHAHPIELFSSCITSTFFFLCLFGVVLGTDCREGLCKVERGAFTLLPTWSALTFLQSPFSWAALAWTCCSLDNAFLWRPWRIRVWVSSGISLSNEGSHNELLCSKIHWASLLAFLNYLANT